MPNRVRFDGRAGRFYEVWYAIFNDPASGDGFWIRYTLLNPREIHPEAGGAVWFAHTNREKPERSVAARQGFGGAGLFLAPDGSVLRIGESEFRDGLLAGRLSHDGHEISWQLTHDRASTAHTFFDGALRRLAETRNSVTLPYPKVPFSGCVTIDGRDIEVREAFGHQAHHWGTAQAERWLWAHCCDFQEDDSAVLECLSAPAPGGWRATFVNLYTRTLTLRCNGVWSLLRNRATSGLGFWRFVGRCSSGRVIADFRVDPRDVHRFVYTAPDYRKSECWNTQVADCMVKIESADAAATCVLRSRGRAAAEIHDRDVQRIPYRAWLDDGSPASPSPSSRAPS